MITLEQALLDNHGSHLIWIRGKAHHEASRVRRNEITQHEGFEFIHTQLETSGYTNARNMTKLREWADQEYIAALGKNYNPKEHGNAAHHHA